MAAMPDEDSKKEAWAKIQDREAHKLSRKEAEQVMAGFIHTDQLAVIDKFNDDFFASLHTMYKNTPYKMFKQYILSLMPRRGEIKDEMIQKLQAYLPQEKNDQKDKQVSNATHSQTEGGQYDIAFTKLIKENVEILQRQKKIRAFAKNKTM